MRFLLPFLAAGCAFIADDEFAARQDFDGDGAIASTLGGDDCDDAKAGINPSAPEVCDGIDNDCDGIVDNDDATDAPSWYADPDGDGYGSTATTSCTQPDGYVPNGGDCADGDAGIHPGAPETWYDGVDTDCDGGSDYDQDADGYDLGEECDDTDPSISPSAAEIWYDGIDENCDALSDNDQDGDGADDIAHGGLDCDDESAAVYPGAPDDWYDGIDANCDGLSDFDADADGYDDPTDGGPDCDDGDPDVHPNAPEFCDGVDHDCDDLVDEDDSDDAPTWYTDADSDTYGDASTGHTACFEPDGDVADATDCDDADAQTAHRTWYQDLDADSFGDAAFAAEGCDPPTGYVSLDTDCNDADPAINPAASELCDVPNVDEDCDGLSDDNDVGAVGVLTYYADIDGDRYGDALNTVTLCDRTPAYVTNSSDCDDTDAAINPGEDEFCDPLDVDEDCDGLADEADSSVIGAGDYYVDADGDGYGEGGSAVVPLCAAAAGYVSNDADCDDTDATVTPADGDCAIDLGAADVILEGEDRYDGAGSSVAAGDLDGDGEDDVLVGARLEDTSWVDGGSAYVYTDLSPGSKDLSTSRSTYRDPNGSPNDYFGSVGLVADLDGDGIDDVVVGAPGFNSYGHDAGAVSIDFGPIALGSTTADGRIILYNTGNTLATLDINSDGVQDLLLGAQAIGAPQLAVGFAGITTGDQSPYLDSDVSIQTWVDGDEFGYSVGGGDLDGDGVDDWIVGAPGESTTGAQEGMVYVFFGPVVASVYRASGRYSAGYADIDIVGDEPGVRVGTHVTAGDVDEDGVANLIATGASDSGGAADGGRVFVFNSLRVDLSVSEAESVIAGATDDEAGTSLAFGDIDADGAADLIVGAAGSSSGAGAAYLLFGPLPAGSTSVSGADAVLVGENSGDSAGSSLATGDIDADGFDDIIVGAPYNDNAGTDAGAAYIVYGSGL